VYPVWDYDWQIKLLNRRVVMAKELKASSNLEVEEGGEAS
jgi:hypothetical protein